MPDQAVSEEASLFKKQTVFVVGAGASAECSLPGGASLRDAIGEGLKFWHGRGGRLEHGDQDLLDMLARRAKRNWF